LIALSLGLPRFLPCESVYRTSFHDVSGQQLGLRFVERWHEKVSTGGSQDPDRGTDKDLPFMPEQNEENVVETHAGTLWFALGSLGRNFSGRPIPAMTSALRNSDGLLA
jgi:hypothetical protein